MGIYLCNFASGDEYLEMQKIQRETASPYFDGTFEFTADWIKEIGYYDKHRSLFEGKHMSGWGWCCWKPVIIKYALEQLQDDDVLLYMDVADQVYNPQILGFVDWTMRNRLDTRFFVQSYFKHSDWTKRDCFVGMGCDDPRFWNRKQLEAGTIGLMRNEENFNLVNEWLSWCEIGKIINKEDNELGQKNIEGFQDHRCDQSILTNLFIRNKYPCAYLEEVRDLIHYSQYDQNVIRN